MSPKSWTNICIFALRFPRLKVSAFFGQVFSDMPEIRSMVKKKKKDYEVFAVSY